MNKRPTFGLALSGSGNRTTFYIGFLEVLDEAGIKIDYISACSGGCVVAAAYACGALKRLKTFALTSGKEAVNRLIRRAESGGIYSLDLVEEEIRKYIGSKKFEDVALKMVFAATDIENGEKIYLCMGDIARAARISCTVPGLFAPVKWGNKVLVDGGLLTLIPVNILKTWDTDIIVGINMRATKHIFTSGQINLKKIYNVIKKMLFFEELEDLLKGLFKAEGQSDPFKTPGLMEVWAKSLDLAILANKENKDESLDCDLIIKPDFQQHKRTEINPKAMLDFYQMGVKTANWYLPKIKQLIENKS
ncbi:MAG: patatin-like phospholipase family protein [Candidatus Doudnabacteria bacterium]|nr:patatin-like phospholipase family protein [Candidatus Doudnabacteria bacterium]